MFLGNIIFVVSYLKIHSAVHLYTLKALTSLCQKENLIKSLLGFVIVIKKDKMVAERPDVQIEQTRILI